MILTITCHYTFCRNDLVNRVRARPLMYRTMANREKTNEQKALRCKMSRAQWTLHVSNIENSIQFVVRLASRFCRALCCYFVSFNQNARTSKYLTLHMTNENDVQMLSLVFHLPHHKTLS